MFKYVGHIAVKPITPNTVNAVLWSESYLKEAKLSPLTSTHPLQNTPVAEGVYLSSVLVGVKFF